MTLIYFLYKHIWAYFLLVHGWNLYVLKNSGRVKQGCSTNEVSSGYSLRLVRLLFLEQEFYYSIKLRGLDNNLAKAAEVMVSLLTTTQSIKSGIIGDNSA